MKTKISLFLITATELLIAIAAFPCSFMPKFYKVAPTFSVELRNELGPASGITIRIYDFEPLNRDETEKSRTMQSDELMKLLTERERTVAQSVTDAHGVAHFSLGESGRFTLEINHPARQLDWVNIEVEPDAAATSLQLQWPATQILDTDQLHGRMSVGLFSSREVPLKNSVLKLHTFSDYRDLATATTDGRGKFSFPEMKPGLYFLEIVFPPSVSRRHYASEGNIPINLSSASHRHGLNISTVNTTCGLSYDLEENKAKYKSEACFKGGKEVKCKD